MRMEGEFRALLGRNHRLGCDDSPSDVKDIRVDVCVAVNDNEL